MGGRLESRRPLRWGVGIALLATLALWPAVAGTQGPQPQPGFVESLCPRAAAPDPDCYTIALPAEVWATAAAIPIKDDPAAIKAYDSLIPEPFFPIPDRREIGVLMFRLDTTPSPARDIDTDPGPGYAEGSVAIRVGFPAQDRYPYREGWWDLAQPLNDQSQYGAGRDIGLPKYMADAGLRIDANGTWRAHATDWGPSDAEAPGSSTVPGANELHIEWTADEPGADKERREQLWTWGQYGEPLFVQTPPYDEQGEHEPALVKFTTVSTLPVHGAPASPVTMAPDPRIGTAKVTLDGTTPAGIDFAELIGPGVHQVAGTSAFTRGFAFITSDNLANNQGEAGAPPPPASSTAECAGPAPGGEWRIFGRNLRNTRDQPKEDAIDASNVAELEPSFIFDTTDLGSGTVHSTPIVADGCLYFGTAGAPREDPETGTATLGAWVFALNAETGEPVWQTKLDVGDPGLLCTGVIGSTPVVDGRVFAIVSQSGSPYAVALDQNTGKVLWRTVLDRTPQVYNCGSPQVFRDVVIAPFTGDQTGPANRGGYTLLDAETGKHLAKTYTIPDEDFEAGFKGAGIWTTAAVDRDTGYAYVGTANPDAGTPEHEQTNSIIKFDVDRKRKTFGEIVDSYKGNPDRYAEDLPDFPFPCDPDHRLSPYIRSVLCAQMDLDFGASPNLLAGPNGQTHVSALQKSGIFHVVNAENMEPVWRSPMSAPVFYGNGSTATTDGSSIFVGSSPPGHMVSLDAEDGSHRWVMPIADVVHYQASTYANGLVYANDAKGHLSIFRADNGLLAGHRWIGGDTGKPIYAEESSGSTAVARNTLYVAASHFVVAYRNGARGSLDDDRESGSDRENTDSRDKRTRRPAPRGNNEPSHENASRDVKEERANSEEDGDGSLPFTGLGLALLLGTGAALLSAGEWCCARGAVDSPRSPPRAITRALTNASSIASERPQRRTDSALRRGAEATTRRHRG